MALPRFNEACSPRGNHEKWAAVICLFTEAIVAEGQRRSSAKLEEGGSGYRRGRCGSLGRKKDLKMLQKEWP